MTKTHTQGTLVMHDGNNVHVNIGGITIPFTHYHHDPRSLHQYRGQAITVHHATDILGVRTHNTVTFDN